MFFWTISCSPHINAAYNVQPSAFKSTNLNSNGNPDIITIAIDVVVDVVVVLTDIRYVCYYLINTKGQKSQNDSTVREVCALQLHSCRLTEGKHQSGACQQFALAHTTVLCVCCNVVGLACVTHRQNLSLS